MPRLGGNPWYDALPGLTFVAPSFYQMVFNVEIRSLNGSFWSLYTEAAFYVVFGAAFFLVGWKRATIAIFALGLVGLLGRELLAAAGVTGLGARVIEPFEWTGFKFFLWFVSGILFAKSRTLESDAMFVSACFFGLLAATVVSPNALPLVMDDRYAMIAVVLLFATALKWRALQQLLEWRPLLFLGAISYPLYLIHDTIGLGLIVLTHRYAADIPDFLLPLPTLVLMLIISHQVFRHVEPRLKRSINLLNTKVLMPAR